MSFYECLSVPLNEECSPSPKHAFALSRVLAEAIGSSYVEIALET